MRICLDCPTELIRTGAQRWPKRCPACQKEHRKALGLERYHRLYAKDPDHIEAARVRARAWIAENPERYRERTAEYNQTHRAESTARAREWYGKNIERVARQPSRQAETRAEHNRLFGRRNYLKSKYGMTIEQFEAMFAAQGGRCAICPRTGELRPPGAERHDRKSWTKGLVVDHDHVTNRVRALLCPPCNSALGQLQDDPEIIQRAADYVLRYRQVLITV